MAMATKLHVAATNLLLVALLLPGIQPTGAQVGISYGTQGNNIPCPCEVEQHYKSLGVEVMRIYDEPIQRILKSVQTSNIKTILGFNNNNLPSFGTNPSAVKQWVQTNVVPYASTIKYIVVGNEVTSSAHDSARFVGPAMYNFRDALNDFNLRDQIKVTTAIGMSLLKNTWPPSHGEFNDLAFMKPVVEFLTNNDSPLIINLYPYFAYRDNKNNINLDYALGNSQSPVVTDFGNGLQYRSLFDAQFDSVYAALAKLGVQYTKLDHEKRTKDRNSRRQRRKLLVAGETGWPSHGGDSATRDYAQTYYNNMIQKAKSGQGTPLYPDEPIEINLFAMFDENNKPGEEIERNFGLYTPDMQPKYQLNF